MDWERIKNMWTAGIGKYRWALLVLLIGLVLMLLPEGEEQTENPQPEDVAVTKTEAQQLEEILAKVQGVGEVEVMLTVAVDARNVYQTDTSDGIGYDTVIVTGENRGQEGLVSSVEGPRYRGAIVVCQGGDDPKVRLAVVEAVCNATGLGADCVTVLKMR